MILSEIDSRNGPIKLVYFVTLCSKKFYYTRIAISAAVLAKSGKAAYTAELLALGSLASVVCTCRKVNCNSAIGMIMVWWLQPVQGRLLDWQGNNSS